MEGHSPITPVLFDALDAIRAELYDDARALERLAPGVTPGHDLSQLGLHAVRESALGAYADLVSGHAARANDTLRAVLALQYRNQDQPWSGTFPVVAEQPRRLDADAKEWQDYDPNWRQFLGVILSLIYRHYSAQLDGNVAHDLRDAVRHCVDGEPRDRIPPWYTNPQLLHAWLQHDVASRDGDVELANEAARRRDAVLDRFRLVGDVDEYNSPTYDGIDLFALCLWIEETDDPAFQAAGEEMLRAMVGRVSQLRHPRLGTVCGPYIRSYGVSFTQYVSLLGLWFALTGVSTMLPHHLTTSTDHVHDLYFAPLFRRYVARVNLHVDDASFLPHRYEHVADGAHATSVLGEWFALGFERGRIPTFAVDQYTPLTLTYQAATNAPISLVARLGTGSTKVDVEQRGTDTLVITTTGDGPHEIHLVCTVPAVSSALGLTWPGVQLTWSESGIQIVDDGSGGDVRLRSERAISTYVLRVTGDFPGTFGLSRSP